MRVNSLSIGPGAALDLYNGGMITSGTSIAQVRSSLIAGRASIGGAASGQWNGLGINSSAAAEAFGLNGSESRPLGYARNGALLKPFTTFFQEAVGDDDILVRFTRNGDATLDGRVDDNDVSIVSGSYNPRYDPDADGPRHWYQGDFNYNGKVDDDGVSVIGGFYDPSVEAMTPEAEARPAKAAFNAMVVPQTPPAMPQIPSLFAASGRVWE